MIRWANARKNDYSDLRNNFQRNIFSIFPVFMKLFPKMLDTAKMVSRMKWVHMRFIEMYFLITGSSPYPGMSGPDVMELINMGYRMDKPKLCSELM